MKTDSTKQGTVFSEDNFIFQGKLLLVLNQPQSLFLEQKQGPLTSDKGVDTKQGPLISDKGVGTKEGPFISEKGASKFLTKKDIQLGLVAALFLGHF